jgi:hypothetical protein
MLLLQCKLGAKHTLELVAKKYYWPGMALNVKTNTQACLTCRLIFLVQCRPHGIMEPLPQLHGLYMDNLVDLTVVSPVSCWKHHT